MIHSASFLATGSVTAASARVASSGLCLRTSSITSSSWSRSSLDVLDVAATAAGGPNLRAGVGAVTRCRTGGAGAATGDDSGVVEVCRPGAVAGEGGVVFGTTLCATGREFGCGGLSFAVVLSDGLSAACLGAGLSVAGLAVDFSLAGLAVDFSLAGLAAGFSAVFFAAGFSVACLVAGCSVA